MMPHRLPLRFSGLLLFLLFAVIPASVGEEKPSDQAIVKAEHDAIGLGAGPVKNLNNTHPDAQWFGEAGLGLFIHWGIASVKGINLSHPMIASLPKGPLSPEKVANYLKTRKYPGCVIPSEYFAQAKEFNPQRYDPERWMKAAKEAGFTYAVLTTKHHEGFAMWPSAYGDFNTRNYMGGRDLVKEWVVACRKYGIKIGLYYSGPDLYFDREYYPYFMARSSLQEHPEFPELDMDYNPRTEKKSPEWIAEHQKAFATMFTGQVEELLTNYGKIDLMWFDGDATTWVGTNKFISLARMRELQPGIVINPRTHKSGDYVTFERTLKLDKPIKTWGELCDTWTTTWSHVDNLPFRAPHYVLGNLTTCRSYNVNYLIGVGPTKDGELVPDIYRNFALVGAWMQKHRDAVTKAKPLPAGEKASVPATALGKLRYLFLQANNTGRYAEDLLPATDATVSLSGTATPIAVSLEGQDLPFTVTDGTVSITVPASRRSTGVDVLEVTLP